MLVKLRASEEKAKASFFRVFLCEVTPEGVRVRVSLPTTNDPIKKNSSQVYPET